ncbi:MAG: DUF3168 domain-containing protein [Candidatus Devosia phytovorans]|uniref:DUF3168 domain-containing protein n=1 Tax=Candidatus Devosia phytovorans TaxID=3121372 RepID=A0AAJ5VVX3_9HYPH|nr:DUF3168 domain-containing protein [Devosia sp.]WEK05774.1 MAG: DUF3168 domain-containing protein [Devosia sp.]
MSDPTVALQQAMTDRLRAILGEEIGVYDFVSEAATLPYATVGVISAVPIDEMCWDRSEVSVQIDLWDDEQTSRKVKERAAVVRDAFHEFDGLVVTGFAVDRMRVDGVFLSREAQTLLNRARIVVAVEAQPN